MAPTEIIETGAFIFGMGAHGRGVAETMQDVGVDLLGFLDDHSGLATKPEDMLAEWRRQGHTGPPPVYVAIGSPPIPANVSRRLVETGVKVAPPPTSPNAYVAAPPA